MDIDVMRTLHGARKQEFASLPSQENFLCLEVEVLFPPKLTGQDASGS